MLRRQSVVGNKNRPVLDPAGGATRDYEGKKKAGILGREAQKTNFEKKVHKKKKKHPCLRGWRKAG